MITLTDGKLQEEWGEILEDCHGEAEGFLRAVEDQLKRLRPPRTEWQRNTVTPSTLKSVGGKRRDAIVVFNMQFREHVIVVMAQPYGATLVVSFYLAGSTRAVILTFLDRIPILNRLLNLIGILRDKDVFDRHDFGAWVEVVKSAVRYAAKQIAEKHDKEVALAWKAKGMFGVA